MIDLFIGLFGLLALVFAVAVLVARQPMRAALALVAHMFCLAAVYACLGVHVVALFQVLIYVGAVMVFMIYTIMLLDDRDPSYRGAYSRLTLPALVVAALVALALVLLLGHGAPASIASGGGPNASGPFSFSAFSLEFIRQYWIHFELATVLLLVGIVAAWTAIKEGR